MATRTLPAFAGALVGAACLLAEARPGDAAESSAACALTISGAAGSYEHLVAMPVLEEAYRRIGCTVTFVLHDTAESLRRASKGESDGEILRIKGTEHISNLVRVPTAVSATELVMYGKAARPEIRSIRDLQGLTVGIIAGVRIAARYTDALDRILARDPEHLFDLLQHGRIDVAVTPALTARIISTRDFPDEGFHQVGDPVWTGALFHFVNVKHAALVDRLDATLRDMARDGEIERHRMQAISRHMTH